MPRQVQQWNPKNCHDAVKAPEGYCQFWDFVKDSASSDAAELLLYGEISSGGGWWDSEDTITPIKFAKDLKNLGNVKEITLRINSGGGSVFAAQAIKALLQSHTAKKKICIDGICASAATIFIDLGNVEMNEGGLFMIHNPMSAVRGNKKDFLKVVDLLDKVKSTLVISYLNKTGKEQAVLEQLMDDETWFTAKEALDDKFIDSVVKSLPVAASVDAKHERVIVNGVPVLMDSFLNKAAAMDKIKICMKGESAMNFQEIFDSLSPEQQETVKAQMESAQTAAEEAMQSKLTEMQNSAASELQKANDQIKELEAKVVETSATVIDPLANVSEEIRAIVLDARAKEAEAKKALQEIEAKQEIEEFAAVAKTFDKIPLDASEMGPVFRNMAKIDKEGFEKIKGILAAANNMITTGTLFTPQGSSQETSGMSAYDQLDAKAKDLMVSAKMKYAEAFQAVCAANHDLYNDYVADVRGSNNDETE